MDRTPAEKVGEIIWGETIEETVTEVPLLQLFNSLN